MKTSGKATATFVLGILCLTFASLALATNQGLLVLGMLGLVLPALILGFWGKRDVRRSQGVLKGSPLAGWGIGLTLVSIGLGFLQGGT